MELRNHQSFGKRMRNNHKRQQKHKSHVSRHRWKFSWRRKQHTHAKHMTYKRYLRKALLKFHRLGYNLLECTNKSVPRFSSGLIDGGQILSYFKHYYVKTCCREMLVACLLLFLLYRQIQTQNKALRIQMVAFLFLLLVKLFVCDCHLFHLLRQMMDRLLTSVVTTLPAGRRFGGEAFRAAFLTDVSCRQQYLQGARSDYYKCRFQLWLLAIFWQLGKIIADCQTQKSRIPPNPPDKKMCKKGKSECLTSKKNTNEYICRLKMLRKYSFIIPQVSDICTFPIGNDLSGFLKCLDSHPIPDEAELLRFEWKRLLTFENCIQQTGICAVRLAKNGFYFVGNVQNPCLTKCFSCDLENDKWEYFSDVEEFHRKHSPHCRHLAFINSAPSLNYPALPGTSATTSSESGNDRGACGVSTLASTAGAIPQTSSQSFQQGAVSREETRTVTPASAAVSMPSPPTGTSVTGASIIPQVSLISTPPTARSVAGQQNNSGATPRVGSHEGQVIKHPEYLSFEDRLRSFIGWPLQIDPSPSRMAEAGFFYTGRDDLVKCFFCGIACYKWNDGESAWVEHAVCNMECPFLKQMRNSDFFDRAKREKSFRERERRQPRPVVRISVPEQDVDPMVTHTAKLLMEQMKISPLLVKQAVQFVWKEKGGFFEDSEMALNWCLDEMEKEKNTSLRTRGGVETHPYVSTIASPVNISRTSGTILYTSSSSVVTMVSTSSSSSNAQEANTAPVAPSGGSEVDQVTAPKHVQESVSAGPPASIVETVATTSSSSHVSAPATPIYTTAGQPDDTGSKKEDAKITDLMKTLFDMGFTYSCVKEELPWIKHLTDSSVEELVEMAVIRITGKMERDNAEAKKSSIETKDVTNSVAASTSSVPVSSSTVMASSQMSVPQSTTQASHTATVPAEGTHLSAEVPILQEKHEAEIHHLATTDKSLPVTKVASVCPSTCDSSTTAISSTSDVLTCAITQTESASSISVTQSDNISSPVLAAQSSAGSSPVLVTQSHVTSPPAPVTSTPCAGMTGSTDGPPLLMSTGQAASEAICDIVAGNNCKLEPTGQVANPTDETSNKADEEEDKPPTTAELDKPTESAPNGVVVEGATGGPPQDTAHKTQKRKKKKSKEKENLQEKPEASMDAQVFGEIMLQVMDMKKRQENLQEKTDSLHDENELLREKGVCKICMDREIAIIFLPCGHLVTCKQCSSNIQDCPICRKKIKDKKTIFAL